MMFSKSKVVLGVALFLALPATDARAHWCDDMWHSAYNLVVRPDSDISPKELYVQNNMGYQLPDFILTATSSSGGAITLTPPTTLKLANTLLPGEKGTWKITAGSPAKIEDITFSVKFGLDFAGWTTQDACYPLTGAKPVMVVKTDGSLYPTTPTGLANPKAPPSPCVGIVALGRSLQYGAISDFEDVNAGLNSLLQYYCAGRASWGIDDNVTKTYCKDTSSTTCPTSKPSGIGRVSDYVHLWAAGDLAIRKGSLDTRLPVFRERLKCGANDGDMGFSGYALFVLGYLGDDAGVKTFLQTKASAGGDLGSIAKAALYLMGDTAQKADVQAGLKSSSVFVKVACAAALGIVDKDDASVTSTIIPEVKWIEPTVSASEDGKGMYAAHILNIVAFDRRGWAFKGGGKGAVTFYGETGSGTGGTSGTGGRSGTGGTSGGGGSTGNRDGGTDAPSVTGGAVGSGGSSAGGGATAGFGGSPGSGGSPVGGVTGNGGQSAGGAEPQSSGGAASSGGVAGSPVGNTAGGSSSHGGSPISSGGNMTPSSGATVEGGKGGGSACSCSLGGRPDAPALSFLALAGLALLLVRRRRF